MQRAENRLNCTRLALLLAAASIFPAQLPAQDSPLISVGSPEIGSSVELITKDLGPPAVASEEIYLYRVRVRAHESSLPADLTLWFRRDKLFFLSYAFPHDRISEELLTHYSWISRELADLHGEPSSRASSQSTYSTEVWNLHDLDIEHTLILEDGRAEHVVTYTAAGRPARSAE